MAKLERMDGAEPVNDVLLERDDTDVALDILNELNQAPQDTNWKFTVCRINTDKNGVAINGALEPQILEGDASIMEDLPGRLREQFGTGRYRVRILMNKRLWKRFDIAVEKPMTQTSTAAIQPQSELGAVLAAFGKQQEQIITLLSRPQTAMVPTATGDPVAMFRAMVDMFKEMRPTQTAPVSTEIPAEKAMDLIMRGVTLAQSIEGSGREKGMMDILSDALNSPVVSKILENAMGPQSSVRLPPPQPRREAKPDTQQVKDNTPDPNATPTQEQVKAEQTKQVQGIIMFLLQRANTGSSFETYAEWAFDTLPPPLIRDILAQPDPVAIMQALVPQIEVQKQWFSRLIDELRELVNSADEAANIDGANVSGRNAPIGPNGNAGRQGGGASDIEDHDGFGESGT